MTQALLQIIPLEGVHRLPLSLTLRQLEYAVAILRHGGLTAAAEALHVSQPALSVALAGLEAELGQPLFLRRPGGPMQPTGFGADWLAEAEAHLAGLSALMRGQRLAPLRLAVFEDLAPAVLAPLLAQSGLAVQARPMGFQALAEALKAGTVDAAVAWALGLPPGLTEEVLAEVAPQAVLAADHPLAARQSLTLADLADLDLVLTDQDLSIAHLQAIFHARGLRPRIAHRCATLDLMRSFAANGLGVGISYTQPAPRISHDGRRLVLRVLADAGREAVVLARRGDVPPPPGLAGITRFLKQLMTPMPAPSAKTL